MAFWHQLGTKPIGKRVLLLPEPRPGPPADPKIICHPEAGNTKYIPLSVSLPPLRTLYPIVDLFLGSPDLQVRPSENLSEGEFHVLGNPL